MRRVVVNMQILCTFDEVVKLIGPIEVDGVWDKLMQFFKDFSSIFLLTFQSFSCL